jgi:hypothetical protein
MFFFSLSHQFLLHCVLCKTCLQPGVLNLHSRGSRVVEGLLSSGVWFWNLKISYFLYTISSFVFTLLPTHLLTYLLTCLLTPWSRVLLEKLTGSQLVKKFPAFYGTRGFVALLTSSRYPLMCQINPLHAPIPLPEDPS